MREETYKTINSIREKYIRIGFITPCGIKAFFGVGYERAQEIYDMVKQEIESETIIIDGKEVHKKVSPLGIRTSKLLEFFDLKESDILRYARNEKIQENSKTTVSKKTDTAISE